MSPRAWSDRVRDILDAIGEIQLFMRGVEYDSFASNREKRKAVLANFAIIGEASRHIPDAIKQRHPGVPWVEMGRMRNFVVHVYFAVDSKIVWDTVQDDLPPLAEQLRIVLNDENPLFESPEEP